MEDKYLVTHYIKDAPSLEGWKKLMFITKRDAKYFHSLSNIEISREKIISEEDNGTIIKLNIPILLDEDQRIWLSDEGKVYVADKYNPFNESRLFQIDDRTREDINSVPNLKRSLNKLWHGVEIKESLKILYETSEWEKVMHFLSIQMTTINSEELPEWLFNLLSEYENSHSTLFYKCCQRLNIIINLLNEEIIVDELIYRIKVHNDDYIYGYMKDVWSAELNELNFI